MRPVGTSGIWGMRAVRRPSTLVLTLCGWVVGLTTTALILGTPYLLFAYYSPDLHLVLDSLDTGVALLVAYLLFGRFQRTQRLQDLLLAEGLLILGLAGVGMTLALQLLGSRAETVDVWIPVGLRVVGALLILTAAIAGSRRPCGRWCRVVKAVPWALLVVAFAVAVAVQDSLPPALAETPPSSAQRPVIAGHPLLLGAQALSSVSFAAASVLFTLGAKAWSGPQNELLRWFGPAFALAAFARLNYLLFPSLYSGWLYTGDLLRTGCYLVLLVGAAREISRYWSAQARAAVLDDRRRLARELHDGVVQELGYIRSETYTLTADAGARERILGACDRALDEARAAVDALGRSSDEPLGFVLHRAARQVAERYHAALDVELDDSVQADADQRLALVRITREAVSNAIRHGHADRVRLRLGCDQQGRRLLVQDDGQGFDPVQMAQHTTGYGLTSMEERARGLHGSLSIDSAPGRGTTVAVTW